MSGRDALTPEMQPNWPKGSIAPLQKCKIINEAVKKNGGREEIEGRKLKRLLAEDSLALLGEIGTSARGSNEHSANFTPVLRE